MEQVVSLSSSHHLAPRMVRKSQIDAITAELEEKFGVVLTGEQIAKAVGIRSRSTLRRWLKREHAAGLKVFTFPGRKQSCVLARDLAGWLVQRSRELTRER